MLKNKREYLTKYYKLYVQMPVQMPFHVVIQKML